MIQPSPALLRLVLTLVAVVALHAKVAAQEPPPVAGTEARAALRSLLPETLAGLQRGEVVLDDDEGVLDAAYADEETADLPPLFVRLFFRTQQKVREEIQRQVDDPGRSVEEIQREGQTIYMFEDGSAVNLLAFPGELAVLVQILDVLEHPPVDPGEILEVFDELDTRRMAAFELPDPQGHGGTARYSARWPSGQLSIAYPSGWTLTDLYDRTGWMEALALTSSATATDSLFGREIEIATGDTVRLGEAENVLVTVTSLGVEGASTTPLEILQGLTGSTVAAEEVTRSPEAVVLDGRGAAVREVAGSDRDGRPIVGQQWAVKMGERMVFVSAFLPREREEEAAPRVRDIIRSLALEP